MGQFLIQLGRALFMFGLSLVFGMFLLAACFAVL